MSTNEQDRDGLEGEVRERSVADQLMNSKDRQASQIPATQNAADQAPPTQPGGFDQTTYNQPGTYSESDGGTAPRQDGYSDTEGSGYGTVDNSTGQPAAATPAQQGYDPTQSGVRPAQNQPGKRVDVPGRETGTSWGEDQQMGASTDTSDRSNPSI